MSSVTNGSMFCVQFPSCRDVCNISTSVSSVIWTQQCPTRFLFGNDLEWGKFWKIRREFSLISAVWQTVKQADRRHRLRFTGKYSYSIQIKCYKNRSRKKSTLKCSGKFFFIWLTFQTWYSYNNGYDVKQFQKYDDRWEVISWPRMCRQSIHAIRELYNYIFSCLWTSCEQHVAGQLLWLTFLPRMVKTPKNMLRNVLNSEEDVPSTDFFTVVLHISCNLNCPVIQFYGMKWALN